MSLIGEIIMILQYNVVSKIDKMRQNNLNLISISAISISPNNRGNYVVSVKRIQGGAGCEVRGGCVRADAANLIARFRLTGYV